MRKTKMTDCRNAFRRASMSAVAGLALFAGANLANAQSMTLPPAAAAPPASAQPESGQPALAMPDALSQPPAEAAPASGCEENMRKYSDRRNAQLQSINNLVKSGKGRGLDPVAACPKFRTLVTIETEMKNWVLKNKDWCSIPDQIIEGMKAGFAKTPEYARKACAAAAQAKNGGLAGPGGPVPQQPSMKLPSGPL